jgi:hypothetical protein
MFDNEIDWVTSLESDSAAARRRGACKTPSVLNTRPSTCKELLQVSDSGKCSSKKSVFRRIGDCTRERARPISEAENRLILTGPKRFGSLRGVNSMVKLLRAHGGCLGRDRR